MSETQPKPGDCTTKEEKPCWEETKIKIHSSDTVSGRVFDGVYIVPTSVADKVALYGEDIVNFVFEARIKSALGHKCRVLSQKDESLQDIHRMLLEWKPTLRTVGRITDKKIKEEKDPEVRKAMIEEKIKQLHGLEDL